MSPVSRLTPWLQTLSDVLDVDLLRPKVLLCKSFAQGHLWVDRLAKEHGLIANVRVETVNSLALQIGQLAMEEAALTPVSSTAEISIIHALMVDLAPSFPSVMTGALITPGVVHAFHDAIETLRVHGVTSNQLHSEQFNNGDKGDLLKALLHRYEAVLSQKKWADSATTYAFAISELAHLGASELNLNGTELSAPVYILPESLRLDGLTKQFMQGLASVHEVTVVPDVVPEAPIVSTGDVHMFPASGSVAEIREVFRRIVASGTPMDEVEIVTSSYDDEAIAVYELAEQLGVEATYSQGLPGTFTNVGQLASTLLDWVEQGYDVTYIIDALGQGLVRIPDSDVSPQTMATCLSAVNIGWGRSRYLPLLQKWMESAGMAERDSAVYRHLYDLFTVLLDRLPDGQGEEWSVRGLMDVIDRCVRNYGPIMSDREASVVAQIGQMKDGLHAIDEVLMPLSTAIRYTRELLASIRVEIASRPEPGKLHVSALSDGGQTGREMTFVVGMSEQSWGLATKQDPILLDGERERIDGRIPTSELEAKRMEEDRRRFLQGLTGQVIFSYSAYSVLDDRTEGPASVLLSVYRAMTGQLDADYSNLLEFMGEPIGYAGGLAQSGAQAAVEAGVQNAEHGAAEASRQTRARGQSEGHGPPIVDELDLWMTNLVGGGKLLRDGLTAVLGKYPWLKRGHEAEQARQSDALTEYDGVVAVHDAGRAADWHISPTALETLGACPRKYFFRYVLYLRPEEVTEFNRSQWLSPLERGSLYHEVFERYMSDVTDGGTRKPAHDEHHLMGVCEQVITEFREQIPAPSEHIAEMECAEIRRSMYKFLGMERDREGMPRFFELQIGEPEAPYPVKLGEGLVIPMVGKVDRIDEIGPHEYRVMDYKTGKSTRYHPNEPFKQGQQLQHAIYAIAVEQWMREQGIDDAPHVGTSAYVFPSVRGSENEVAYHQTDDLRQSFTSLVGNMLGVIQSGVFPAPREGKSCTWCDFLPICTMSASTDSKRKRENPENAAVLTPLTEVQDYA